MKKKYFKLLFTALGLLPLAGLQAQTYTAGDITATAMPVMSHDSSMCSSTCMLMYNITITSSFMGDSVKIVDLGSSSLIFADGNATGIGTWTLTAFVPILNPVITDDQLMGGPANFFGPNMKIISGTDTIAYISNMFILPVTDPCHYGSVSGTVYIDNNSDCVYNAGDVALNAIPVTSVASLSSPSTSSVNASAYSGSTGTYNMTVQESWMTSYNVTIPSSYYFIFPHTSCFSGAYTYSSLPQVNVDFPLQCTGSVDVQCGGGAPANIRVGVPFNIHPYVSNTGCDSISGTLTLVKDSRAIYDPSLSPYPATTVSGDTLKWNYVNLCNLTDGAYWNSFVGGIHLTPDGTVHIGDTLCFRIYTGVPSGDTDPLNNDVTICLPVVYSYDPNVKEVSPKGTGTTGDIPVTTSSLTYTLHFQNTGTAAAYNVKIIDTLDSHINAQSLRILGTSHRMAPEWLAPGVVQFTFSNIMLPDSATDQAGSQGQVSFSVKLNTGLAAGTQIKNKGYIYFDNNTPVITNTARNTLVKASSVTAPAATGHAVTIYPNPASDQLYVEHLQSGTVSIVNLNGSVILSKPVTSDKMTIDISKIPAGIYMVKAISDGNTITTRFVKQ